jgi:hypothetical protein
MSLVAHVMTPRRQALIFSPFDTGFDTASRFWVSNGIKWYQMVSNGIK